MTTKLFRSDIKAGTPLRLVSNDTNGKLTELVYSLQNANDWATADDGANLKFVTQYAIKKFVEDSLIGVGGVSEWQDSVKELLNTPPGSPVEGDRYLIGVGTGVWTSKNNQIATYKSSAWSYVTPLTGYVLTIDNVSDGFFVYSGSTWDKKIFGIEYVAGNGINISTATVSIKIETSNSGLELSANGLKLKVNTANFKLDDTNGLGFKNGTAVGQVWYWNGSNWVADTFINLFASKYKTNVGFSGTKDGSNKTFVINNGANLIIETTLNVYKNGMKMAITEDYTYTNATKTLVFTAGANAPESDTVLICDFCEV